MNEQPNKSTRSGITDEAVSEVADVGKTLISGITPADKGWILGFIVVVFIIVASDVMTSRWQNQSAAASSIALTEYLIAVEANRHSALDRQAQLFSDQVRRSQEVIRDLAQAVARDSERAGMAALTAIEKGSDRLDSNFIGPMPERN